VLAWAFMGVNLYARESGEACQISLMVLLCVVRGMQNWAWPTEGGRYNLDWEIG
jgi:hypothetical protein